VKPLKTCWRHQREYSEVCEVCEEGTVEDLTSSVMGHILRVKHDKLHFSGGWPDQCAWCEFREVPHEER
jgi:hypothetical protein